MSELKPCPFCGGKARADTVPARELWGVICDSCDTWQDTRSPSREEAVVVWNRRADLHSLPDEVVERLRGAVWSAKENAENSYSPMWAEHYILLRDILAAVEGKP